MSHEFETGFFVEAAAWHGLGIVLAQPPRTIGDAIRAAALDRRIDLQPMLTLEPGGSYREVPERRCVVQRCPQYPSLDGRILGTVGADYTPLQPAAAFGFFAPWLECGAATLEAAGSLREGRRLWVLAKIAGVAADVVPGDTVESYVLLASSHDGSLAVSAGFTAVRVVCANTLAIALGEGRIIQAKHTSRVADAVIAIRNTIDVQRRTFEATAEQMRHLAAVGCDDATLKRYVREVFAPGRADDLTACERIVAQVVPLFEAGRGTDVAGVRGTLWGAYNSVTEFLTHVRGRDASSRRDSLWFGEGAKLTSRALTVASAYAAA